MLAFNLLVTTDLTLCALGFANSCYWRFTSGLQQIKGVLPDVMFGGVSILAVGDLYQLPPVGQPALFDTVTDAYACLYGSVER